ncbi:o-succinylbenzoate synthase [Corynebacterium caspium]|uniref:o-succinylbenzoate synthase n=1 Tax=Corynebacterium caspium TaxID=234828 RepID=UPI000378DA6B|nr:o-succinylbenzoate synthase [Corynebacterium caspium]WKD59879.1 L-Ala-D/L-Glu epimerase [Corynebacterium caspium DSM 44850]
MTNSTFQYPPLAEILERTVVVALPMRVKFRGITVREAALFAGPQGWGEFSPFLEYAAEEAVSWLASGLEAGWQGFPVSQREYVEVNATIPAVGADKVPEIMERFSGCRTFKVKVAEPGQSLAEDIARVQAVRDVLPTAVIRVDANRGWTVPQAVEAAQQLGPLDYMEQPCATVEELRELKQILPRRGLFVRVAADESIRRAEDPYRVAKMQAADVAVVKVAPLGGVRRTVQLAKELHEIHHMDITVASALDTAVGLNAGLAAVAALEAHEDDDGYDVAPNAAGLATAELFLADVAAPVAIVDGRLPTAARIPEDDRLAELAAPPIRRDWWIQRIRETYPFLSQTRC